MKRLIAALLLAGGCGFAQQAPAGVSKENADLDEALAEAQKSPVDLARAIERHLAKYPGTQRRAELEYSGFRAAAEAGDNPRIILFGEAELRRTPDNLQALERVSRALLAAETKDAAERALTYSRRYEEQVKKVMASGPPTGVGAAEFEEQSARALSRASTYQARANGNAGRAQEALTLAARAYELWPSADPARERARWAEKLDQPLEAALALADACTVPDSSVTPAQRERDRARMGEFYRKAKAGAAGLGDFLLEAFNRNETAAAARLQQRRAVDPNFGLTDPMEFTLRSLDGQPFPLSKLKGKVVLFDFWATWCGPCRAQHPLYAEVRRKYQDNPDVVLLSVNSDEDRSRVAPFLAEAQWKEPVYYEQGLANLLKVSSLPMAILIGKNGQIASRMEGFAQDRFVRMLTERIEAALKP